MPFRNQIHVDTLLSQISVKYRNNDFIAMDVFPELQVKKDSDLYRIYSRNFRIPQTSRANKGLAREHFFEVSTASYNLEDHALKDYVSDDDQENYDLADLRADTTEELTDKILQRLELSVASLFTTTNWSLNVSLAAGLDWVTDTTTSNPIPTVDTAATTIIANSGHKPNFGIVPRPSFIGAKNHQSVLDRIKHTSAEMTPTMLAALFDLEKLLIPTAVQDTSNRGATEVIADIWGDSVFVGFRPPRATPKVPSSGYIFRKNIPMVRRWREEARRSEAIEVEMKYQAKVIASLTGFLIKDTQ